MSLRSWRDRVRSMLDGWKNPQNLPERRRVRVQLENLEDRCVPAIINVTSFADGPLGVLPPNGQGVYSVASLRTAVSLANANPGADTINLANGTYNVTLAFGGQLIVSDPSGGALTIQNNFGGVSIIDATQQSRLFENSTQLNLIGLQLQNGLVSNDEGGAIFAHATVTARNTAFVNNQSVHDGNGFARSLGGAIAVYTNSADPILLDFSGVTFRNNQAVGGISRGEGTFGTSALGGAIAVDSFSNCSIKIANCTFVSNQAVGGSFTQQSGFGSGGGAYGGAIYAVGVASLAISNTTFDGNIARGGDGFDDDGGSSQGGAVDCERTATVNISRTTFSSNQAIGGTAILPSSEPSFRRFGGDAQGGGLFLASPTVSALISNSTFSGNSAQGGNGFANVEADSLGGAGTGQGGGIYASTFSNASSIHLVNNTIAFNRANGGNGTNQSGGNLQTRSGQGGGVFTTVEFDESSGDKVVDFRNTIVAKNTVNGDASNGPDVFGEIAFSVGNNLIGQVLGTTGVFSAAKNDLFGGNGAPLLDPHLAALAFNGGPTKTHALLANSTAIDAGSDSVLVGPFSFAADQRGFARKARLHVDIGAFELPPVPVPPVTVVGKNQYYVVRTGQSFFLTAITGLLKGVDPKGQKLTIQFIPGSGPEAGTLISILPSGAFSYRAPATIPADARDSQGRHRQVVSFRFNLFAGTKRVGTYQAFITIIPGGRGQGPRP